ncbi:MAG: hypothetical protein II824_07035 [Bacteroidales bacterium]|nr:hypothetical protein [Bacteroidales bacterium]
MDAEPKAPSLTILIKLMSMVSIVTARPSLAVMAEEAGCDAVELNFSCPW